MKACYILGRSLKQLILQERVYVEIRTVCRTFVNHYSQVLHYKIPSSSHRVRLYVLY